MARKIQTLFIDDLDGGPAEGTVHFGLDGTDYEIDLSAANARELRDIVTRYAEAGRKVTATSWWPARNGRKTSPAGRSTREVRAWARAHGMDVKTRGRIPAEVIAQFQASTSAG